jgi:plasmid stabilization system protein ParE
MKKEYHVIFTQKANEEIIESYLWYDEQSKGLGERFVKSIEATVKTIKRSPDGFTKTLNYRQVPVKKFPFVIVYERFDSDIVILAVFHTHRDPFKK